MLVFPACYSLSIDGSAKTLDFLDYILNHAWHFHRHHFPWFWCRSSISAWAQADDYSTYTLKLDDFMDIF